MTASDIRRSIRFSLSVAAGLAILVAGGASSAFANQAHLAGALGRVIGSVNSGAEKYFTVNMREGATARDTALVAQYFRRFGLQVTSSPGGEVLFVHGTYGQAGAAAHTGFARVQLNDEQFTRTTANETYPAAIASRILATTIYDGPRMHAMNIVRPLTILVGPGGGYSPANIATYYDFNPLYTAGIHGGAQNVAIVSCGTVLNADITAYDSVFGLPSNHPTIVSVDGGSTTQDVEPTLDVERVLSTANKANVFLYVVPLTCSIGTVADAFAKVVADNATKHFASVSLSYGSTEQFYDFSGTGALMTAEDTDLKSLQTGGAYMFVASGDTGAYPSDSEFLEAFSLTVAFPASDNHVIAVGGTSATSVSPTSIVRNRELGWGGSGGGVSEKFALPTWQVGFPGLVSTSLRNVPDVALDSDPSDGYAIVFTPPAMSQGIFIVGGTSAAAPTWAGIMALVDQKRKLLSKVPLSNVGVDLYAASKVAGNFLDITQGCNGFYCAKAGYDAVTGVGVPDANNLVLFLAGLAK
jgi:subtilase family serine protease